MEIVKWVGENWMVVVGSAVGVILALIALLKAIIAILVVIPGDQGEAALQKIVDFVQKIADFLVKVPVKK